MPKPKQRKVKGWATISKNGAFRRAFQTKRIAAWAKTFFEVAVVPCTITYRLPSPKPKKK